MMTEQQKLQTLIDNIDWDKEFEELSIEHKANYCGLRNIKLLTKEMYPTMTKLYNADRMILEHRAKENLWMYIDGRHL